MEIPNTIGILGQSQDKINRQFYKMLQDAEAGDASAIKALADKIGDDTTANTILKRLKDIETDIGSESTANSMLKRIKDLETAVGDADSGLVKSVATINSEIGDEETADTILYRIKALEPSG